MLLSFSIDPLQLMSNTDGYTIKRGSYFPFLEIVASIAISVIAMIHGREPGRSHHVHDDILCVVLCAVW